MSKKITTKSKTVVAQAPVKVSAPAEPPEAKTIEELTDLQWNELQAMKYPGTSVPVYDAQQPEIVMQIVNMVIVLGGEETLKFLRTASGPEDILWQQPLMEPARQNYQEELNIRTIREDVMVGAIKCFRCGSMRVKTREAQTRAADEATSVFYECSDCGQKWRN